MKNVISVLLLAAFSLLLIGCETLQVKRDLDRPPFADRDRSK